MNDHFADKAIIARYGKQCRQFNLAIGRVSPELSDASSVVLAKFATRARFPISGAFSMAILHTL